MRKEGKSIIYCYNVYARREKGDRAKRERERREKRGDGTSSCLKSNQPLKPLQES
jgi:hypothetical protein